MGSGAGVGGYADGADHGLEIPPRDATGTEQDGLRLNQREDRGFNAHLAGSAVENVVDVVAEAAEDVVGGGGRKFGESICAGRGERNTSSAAQGKGNGMGGHAQADRGQTGGDDEGDGAH